MEAQNETQQDIGEGPKGIQRRWLLELKLADKREKDWRKTGNSIWDKYRAKNKRKNSFNILWSNTETLAPAVYNSLPKPDVRRRFKDADPVGKAISEVLSRCLSFSIDIEQFDTCIKHDLLDMLLPGRGISRVRYVPSLVEMAGQEVEEEADVEAMESEQSEEVAWEQVVLEHVQWDDFRMGAGKTWEEVSWISFHHRMTRDDLIDKFGEVGKTMKLDDADDEDIRKQEEQTADMFKTASVYEIWDKDEKQVLFISSNATEPLKIVEDPLKLTSFFPIPRPIYAITDSGSMIPTALYTQYQEQADELDRVSTRLNKIVDALRVRGIYDSTMKEVANLLKSNDNDLIPADNAAAWLERGGIEKAIWMMPIEKAAAVVTILTNQREAIKQVIYEINGLGDILRGASNANETLGAQQIKAQWGTMRVSTLQRELQRYIRDVMRIMAEIIGEKFQLETLQKMTGLNYPTEAMVQQEMMQYQQAMAQYQQMGQQAMQQAQMTGQQPQQPPPPPQQPQKPPYTWESLQAILKDDCQRTYKIDVETDSTTAATIQQDMQGLTELLGGIVNFMQGAAPAIQMGALPMEAAKEIMLTIVRRAKMGNAVEDALDKMQQPKAPPDPEAAKAQAEQQAQQAQMQHEAQLEQMKATLQDQQHQRELAANAQAEQASAQITAQLEQHKQEVQAQQNQHQNMLEAQRAESQARMDAALEAQRIQSDERLAGAESQLEIILANLNNAAKIEVAEIGAGAKLHTAQMAADKQNQAIKTNE
jgi:hypothetical protein